MRSTKFIITFAITLISVKTFGQDNNINKLDSKGKKTGYWKVYLDENTSPVDSTESVFWGYEFYNNGKSVFKPFVKYKKSDWLRITFEGYIPPKGHPVPIDGIFKTYQVKDGKDYAFLDENSFKNGYPQKFIAHYSKIDENDIWVITDFTKKYENMEGSYFVTDYHTYFITSATRKKTTCWWFRKVNNKWKMVKTDPPKVDSKSYQL